MTENTKLFLVKLIHTLIWLIMVTAIFYTCYSGFTNKINTYTWLSIAMIIIEGLILLIFRSHCPLTLLARKYSDSVKDNFDIFLPNIIARYNQKIFTSIFVLGLILVGYRIIVV